MSDDAINDAVPAIPPPVWGIENPDRGLNFHLAAKTFVRAFPVGTTLEPADFDEWAIKHGYLAPPKSHNKQTDSWKGFLQRRHELKYGINRAGTHTRMKKNPFVIESSAGGRWEVRSPQAAIAQSNLANRVISLMVTKRRQLAYLMQSADYSSLPSHDRAYAEALADDIRDYGENVERLGRQLNDKFSRLRRKLEVAAQSGVISANSDAIKSITEVPTGD